MRHPWPRRREQANHTDDWLMTYADMITLLLCFFAIFLSVSLPRKNNLQKIQIPVPIEQGKLPDVLEGNLPFHGAEYAKRSAIVVPVEMPKKTVTTTETQPPPVAEIPKPVEKAVTEPKPAEPPPPPATPPAQPISKPPISLPEIVGRLQSQGPAKIEQKGDRITTLEINSAAFFGSGSAALSAAGEAILRDVVGNLKSDRFRDYQITVEGHTDDSPIHTLQFPSNWELSTARAAAVVHFFLDQGIPAPRLRAAGYADTFPVAPNRNAEGGAIPENQARNRRVVIKLEKIEKTPATSAGP